MDDKTLEVVETLEVVDTLEAVSDDMIAELSNGRGEEEE